MIKYHKEICICKIHNNCIKFTIICVYKAAIVVILAYVQYTRLSQLFTIIWSTIMATYMLITSAMIANLYTRYCDDATECQGYEHKFIMFPVFGFFLMVAWVSDMNVYGCLYTCSHTQTHTHIP